MRKHLLYILGTMVFALGCNNSNNNNASSIADKIIAENKNYQVILQDETIADSIEGLSNPVKQTSLWLFNKKANHKKRLLLSHPGANCNWFSMEHAVSVPLDSIPTIQKVTILSWEGEPLKLLVEGSPDYRNVQSFIVEADKNTAICMPTNRGLIGVSGEDGLLIMQSYAYYEDGGRFNVIEAFDLQGNRISSMDTKTRKTDEKHSF